MRKQFATLIMELTSIKIVSSLTGIFAKSFLSKPIIPLFAKLYKINVAEAELPLSAYRTLNHFFTRKLKPGARSIQVNPNGLVSPVDARITAIGQISESTTLYVKGQYYTVSEILDQHSNSEIYRNGRFIVLYLSPTDYHRIHAPVSGDWVAHSHTPGAVLPVHNPALTHVSGVLRRNERLTTYIQNPNGQVAVIKVGAMNVASIQYATTINSPLLQGQELAYFEFGSTVVLFIQSLPGKAFEWDTQLKEGDHVKLGQSIGQWNEQAH
jgi:phosphatidylserine decarboxylase